MPEYGTHRCDRCAACETCLICGSPTCSGFPDGRHRLLRGEYEDRLEPPLPADLRDDFAKHAALIMASYGYREFVASKVKSRSADDVDDLLAFADWRLTLRSEAREHSAWTRDQWQDLWDHWNS